MISIGNYRVDNVNWFKEHEGCDAFQCDILYLNKKIGSFSEDYMAGSDHYNFLNGSFDDNMSKLKNAAISFFDNYSKDVEYPEPEDFFIRFLQSLKEAEEKSSLDDAVVIDTLYPFDYDIVPKKDNEFLPLVITDNNKDLLRIPKVSFNINIDLTEKEADYEL